MRAETWLALSFLLAALTSGVTRFFAPGLERTARLIRWVALPYLGLILGMLSPRLMGLSAIDWAVGLRVGIVLLAGMLPLLVIVRIGLHTDRNLLRASPPSGPSSGILWLESGAQEFHWCFLRGAASDLLLSAPAAVQVPMYWSAWVGAALALPGILIHPKHPSDRLITAVILLTTSSLFLYTRNFWLCWLLHLSIRATLQWDLPAGRRPA